MLNFVMASDENQSITTINNLPDEILEIIIADLPIVDHVRLERVSQRWQFLCRRTWHRSSGTLSLDHRTWGFRDAKSVIVTPDAVRNILERCGRHLRKITFSFKTRSLLEPSVLEHVARLCPSLTDLHAGCLTASDKSLEVLAQCCQNLKILELGFVNNDNPVDGDAALSAVFRKNQHLRCVFLRDNETITGTCLQALNPQSLEQLAVLRCRNFDVLSMRAALKFNNAIRMVIEPLQTKQSIYIIMTELSKMYRCYRVKLLTNHVKLICVKEGADRRIVPQEMVDFMRNSQIITDSAYIINEP